MTTKLGDNALGSICPSVRPFVCALTDEPFDLRPSLSTTKQGDNRLVASVRPFVRVSVCLSVLSCLKEQRRVIISPRCLSVFRLSRADAVDRFLIKKAITDYPEVLSKTWQLHVHKKLSVCL